MSMLILPSRFASTVAASWTPADLASGPTIWLNDESTITDNGSGICTLWSDISGNGFDFHPTSNPVGPTIISNGLNSLPTIRFNGSTQDMECSATGAKDIMRNQSVGWCLVGAKKSALDSSNTTRAVLSFTNGTTASSRFYVSFGSAKNTLTINTRRLDGDSTVSLGGPLLADTNFHMFLAIADFANKASSIWYDGALSASGATSATSGATSDTSSATTPGLGVYFGNGNTPLQYCDIEFAEVIMGTGAVPTSSEIDKLFGYLAWRRGLVSNLPANHPYKTSPP
jgi:hypothetical protein